MDNKWMEKCPQASHHGNGNEHHNDYLFSWLLAKRLKGNKGWQG
jgi:hypothetical protein